MPNFLKNFSPKKTSLNKLMVFSFLGLLIFALLLPINSIQAQGGAILGALGAGAQWIAQAILGLALQTILLMAEGILAIGIALLSGVIGFTLSGSLSLTSPAGNEIIRIGWTLVRDFVNIGFILGLVYIGLATALRIAGFELKKVFPWFLIMALLINFTPVICGVVVDAANMVTKFFLGAMANWSLLGEVYSLHKAALGDLFTTVSWVPLAKFVFLIAFGFVAGFVLLVFAVLLLLRFVLIPLLVIFSPLAFLAYIFPRTRSYFTQWWNQLLQWSFIGAIGGFFLYLSRLALREQARFSFAIPTEDPALGTFMEQIAPYFMAVAFLMVGLFITLSSSAMGANVVTGFAKKQGMKAMKWGGKKLGTATEGVTGAIGRGIGEEAKKGWEKGRTKGGKVGRSLGGGIIGAFKGTGKALTEKGREEGIETVERLLEKAHVVRPGFYEARRRKRLALDEEKKRLKNLSPERREEIIERRAITTRDIAARMALLELQAEERSLKDKYKRFIPQAKAFGVNLGEMVKARPDWASEIGKEIRKQVEGRSPKQFTKETQPEALRNIEVVISMGATKMRHMLRYGTEEQKTELTKWVKPRSSNYRALLQKARAAHNAGETEERDRITGNIAAIRTSPYYRP